MIEWQVEDLHAKEKGERESFFSQLIQTGSGEGCKGPDCLSQERQKSTCMTGGRGSHGLGSWGDRSMVQCIAPDGSTSGWNPARDSDELGVAAQASRDGRASISCHSLELGNHRPPRPARCPPSILAPGSSPKAATSSLLGGLSASQTWAHPGPPIWIHSNHCFLLGSL